MLDVPLDVSHGAEDQTCRSDICDNDIVALALMLIFSKHCKCGLCSILALDLYLGLWLDFLFLDHMVLDRAWIVHIHSFFLLRK